MLKQFKTLTDLCNKFSDNQVALDHFRSIRWRDGEFCPYCGHDKVYTLKANRYQCAQCRNTFSILVGTIFENTKLPLKVWFGAIWLLTNHPKGIASTTLARDLGITQKSAWFVLHRLRHAARTQSFNMPSAKKETYEKFVRESLRRFPQPSLRPPEASHASSTKSAMLFNAKAKQRLSCSGSET